jgi:hypothetical protein
MRHAILRIAASVNNESMRYNSCVAEEVSYGQRASILVSGEALRLGLGTAPYVGRVSRCAGAGAIDLRDGDRYRHHIDNSLIGHPGATTCRT